MPMSQACVLIFSCLLGLNAVVPALQKTHPASSVAVPSSTMPKAQNAGTVCIPDGTVVRLLLVESISGKTAKADNSVQFRVIDEVKVGDLVVIANKAPALATIANINHSRRGLRAGTIGIKFASVTLVNGETHKLRGVPGVKGAPVQMDVDPSNEASLAVAVLALPFLPFVHGNEASLRKGTVLTAALDGDVIIDRADVEADQPPVVKKEGPATITVYWQKESALHSTLWCGNVRLGNISPGHYVALHLPAGTYWFSLSARKSFFQLEVNPGEEYFMRVGPFTSKSAQAPYITEIEHDVGEMDVSETAPLETGKIANLNAANLSDLLANPHKKR